MNKSGSSAGNKAFQKVGDWVVGTDGSVEEIELHFNCKTGRASHQQGENLIAYMEGA